MRSLAERYAGRAEFLFVYCREAHRPEGAAGDYFQDGLPIRQAADLAERRQGAGMLARPVEPARRLLLDGFGDDSLFERLFGKETVADNPALVVGADGRVARVLWWTDAEELERLLKELPAG